MGYRILALALLLASTTRADERPLSLEDAIDLALQQAPQVAAASATLEASVAIAPSAGRLPDPELATAIDNLPINTVDRFSLTRDFMTMRRIGIMQSFPNREKRHLASTRASQQIAVAQAELGKSRFDTAQAASDAWIAFAVSEESLTRLRTLRPDIELQAAAARGALAGGRTSTVEALAAQALVARIDERILSLEQDAEMRQAELARWIGEAAERGLAPIPTNLELGRSMQALVMAVPQHSPIAPFLAEIALAQTDVALARAEKHPDWSAELSYQKRGPEFSDMASLEFRVGLPFFTKHRQNPVIAEKLAMVRAQEAERDAQVRMHTAEVQATFATWRRGRERLTHYAAELLPLARDRSRAAVASYGAGRGDLRGAIDALTEETDDELEYVQLQGDVARAWAFLQLLHDSETPK